MKGLFLMFVLVVFGYSAEANLSQSDITRSNDVANPARNFVIPRWDVIRTIESMGSAYASYTYATSATSGFSIQLVEGRKPGEYRLLFFDLEAIFKLEHPSVEERIPTSLHQRGISFSLANAIYAKWVNLILKVGYGQNFDFGTTGGTAPAQLISCETRTTGPITAAAYGVESGTEVEKFRTIGQTLNRFVSGSAEVSEADVLRILQ